jgi:hypothetical protein
MTEAALFIGWGEVARGCEKRALDVYNERRARGTLDDLRGLRRGQGCALWDSDSAGG